MIDLLNLNSIINIVLTRKQVINRVGVWISISKDVSYYIYNIIFIPNQYIMNTIIIIICSILIMYTSIYILHIVSPLFQNLLTPIYHIFV